MAPIVSKFQVQNPRTFAGLSDTSYLYNNYLAEPHKLASMFTFQFSLSQNNIVNLLTGGLGNTLEVDSNEYWWDLYSRNDKTLTVTKNWGDGGSTPGIQGSVFRLSMDGDWWEVGDVLYSDKGNQVQVKDKQSDGSGYIYTLKMNNPDPIKFVSSSEVSVGAQYSKMWTAVEEGSVKGGGIITSTGFKLHNRTNILRKDYSMTRSVANTPLIVDMFDPRDPNKKTRLWTTALEWTAISEFQVEIEKSMMYSIYNKNLQGYDTNLGKTSRPIQCGAGIREQISPSNVRYYSELTYDILDSFLLDLSYSAKLWGGHTKFVALTGKMGMREFNRAISEQAKTNGFLVTDGNKFITGSGSELEFGGYFTKVKMQNGIELQVVEFPLYDDLEMHRELDPKSGYPLESYRFTILNVGKDGKGASNIRKVVRKGAEMIMWHSGGSIDMSGKVKTNFSQQGSSSTDGAEAYLIHEGGVIIQDPTSCGELVRRIY